MAWEKVGDPISFRCSESDKKIIAAAAKTKAFLDSKRHKGDKSKSDDNGKKSTRCFSKFVRGAALEKAASMKKALEEHMESNKGNSDDTESDEMMRLLKDLDAVTLITNDLVTSLDRLLGGLVSGGRRKDGCVVDVRRGIEKARMEMQHALAAQRRLEALEASKRAEAKESGETEVAERLVEERVALSVMLDDMLISTEDLTGMFKSRGRRDARWVAGVRTELEDIQTEMQRVRELDRRLQELEERQRIEDIKRKEKPPETVRPGPNSAEVSVDLV